MKKNIVQSVCTLLVVMAVILGISGYTATMATPSATACNLDKAGQSSEQP